MRLDLFLGLRFLREGRLQAALIVGGAATGVAVFVFLTALVAAVERSMVGQTLDVLPHVVVRPPREAPRLLEPGAGIAPQVQRPAQRLRAIDQWQAVLAALRDRPGVRAAAPTATGPATATRGAGVRAVTLIGIEPASYAEVMVALPRRVRQGAFRLGADEVLVGVDLAEELGLGVGDTLRIAADAGGARTVTVAGIFDLGNRDPNLRWVFASLRTGQALLGLPGGASTLEVRLDDLWAARREAAALRARTGLRVEGWMETNGQILAALRSQRGSTRAIQVFVGLAAVAGIASVLVVSVVQRSRQIGILRAMGLSRAALQRVFLVQGAAIGLGGALLGGLAGTGLALLFETSAHHPDGSPLYPVVLPPGLYLAATLLSVGAGLVAAVSPARRAARLDPAEAIRRE